MDSFGEVLRVSTAKSQQAYHRTIIVMAAALASSVMLNVVLAHRVRSLTYIRSARMADYQLKIGASMPPITARRLDGQLETLSYQGAKEPTVLYIFTPPCVWCARNMDNFKALADKGSAHYRFIGLSLSQQDLADYVAKNKLTLPVYSGLSPETLATYKLGSTPQTIVISPEGKVLQTWPGAYVGEQQSQVEAFFHVRLPGLREQPKAEMTKN